MPGAVEFTLTWDFAIRFLSITLIDLALSGDNAIVIGMAAASLPGRQRKWAILGGGGLAVLLRVALTTITTFLMTIPLLSAVGGCVLFWVAWKLLRLGTESHHPEDRTPRAEEMRNLRQAIILIVTADFMMSLDNVIAIAGSAHGSVPLILAGLLLSMPLLMGTGGAISMLIERFAWLVPVGAAVICFTGTRMIFEDRLIESSLGLSPALIVAVSVGVGAALTLSFARANRRRAERAGGPEPMKPRSART